MIRLDRRGSLYLAVFLYQKEEYQLFLSEYDLLPKEEERGYFNTQEAEQKEQVTFKEADYRLFLEKKSNCFLTQEAIKYSGGILIVKGLLEEYRDYEDMFSYETVLELIFKDGCLITTVDHSKAVLRIRRNLERGLRNMNNSKDRRCIQKFMHRTVICDYRQSRYAYGKKKLFKNLQNGFKVVKERIVKRKE